ncbi:heavy-metal-associated domain-containing protein [Leucobacter sp. HNU]|uniref:heavy-metal-associated domain-containing protein n=1 Tax=Leucobacter sp. HNU TaxID=3236805 RepID=UPI003A80C6E5
MRTNEYKVTGMTCGHCEKSVREEVERIAAVEAVEVSALTGRLVVTSAGEVADAEVIAAVEEAGYTVVPAH